MSLRSPRARAAVRIRPAVRRFFMRRLSVRPPVVRAAAALCLAGLLWAAPAAGVPTVQEAQAFACSYPTARQAVAAGVAQPIAQIVRTLRAQTPGRMLDYEYDCNANLYRVKWETTSRTILVYVVDAGTGRILSRR